MPVLMHNISNPGRKNIMGKLELFSLFGIICLLSVSIISSAAAVSLTPENPVVGDTVSIAGVADPDSEIPVSVSFTTTVPVENGEYEYTVSNVDIPPGSTFHVKATGVGNLQIKTKFLFWVEVANVPASSGVATYSLSAPISGTYSVRLQGSSSGSSSSVTLKITGTKTVSTDSSGRFEYSYDTSSIPAGEFTITVGGESETYTLGSGSSSGSSSSGGGSSSGTTPDSAAGNVLLSESLVSRVLSNHPIQFNFTDADNPVTSINFTSGITRASVPVKVEVLKGVPAAAGQEISGIVYRYLVIWIGYEGFADSGILNNAYVDFRVDKTWLAEHNVSSGDVVFMHYDETGSVWEEVPTEISGEDGGDVSYRAYPDSFSPFAIAAPGASAPDQQSSQETPGGNVNVSSGEENNETGLSTNTSADPAVVAPAATLVVLVFLLLAFISGRYGK
jgi:PGF-pre-PGF domain-containing protein